jgi:hypothetical protein
MRFAQSTSDIQYRHPPQPRALSGVVPVLSDSPLATPYRTMSVSDGESSSYPPNVTLATSTKTTSADRQLHSARVHRRALPTTGFNEDTGLDENGWSG